MVAMQSPKVVASTTADVRDRILNRFQTVVKPLLASLKRNAFKGLTQIGEVNMIARCACVCVT